MHALASLLLITTLTFPTSELILRSGAHIPTDGSVAIDNGRVVFRSAGALYSIPEADVDLDASRSITAIVPPIRVETPFRLKVTREERDRLLRELEENHSGGAPASVPLTPVPKSPQLAAQDSPEEWQWKERAQGYEESIRRAQEQLDLLRRKVEQLQSRIRFLLMSGFKTQAFTFDTTELEFTRDQIPQAELNLQRAQREYALFLDNARRQGVLPGWLR